MPKSKKSLRRRRALARRAPAVPPPLPTLDDLATLTTYGISPRLHVVECPNAGALFYRQPGGRVPHDLTDRWPEYPLLAGQAEQSPLPARIYIDWGQYRFAAFPAIGSNDQVREICDCQQCRADD